MSGYTKLFGSILESTIWQEDDKTRIVWITMLAMSNQHGEVEGSIPGLASRARVSIPETEMALQKLMAPDGYSTSKAFDGRRVAMIDGGWILLNYAKYRKKASIEERKEKARIRAKRFRDNQKGVTPNVTLRHAPSRSDAQNNDKQKHIAEADAKENPSDASHPNNGEGKETHRQILNKRTQRFIACWCAAYGKVNGQAYLCAPADAGQAQIFLKLHTDAEAHEVVSIASRAWKELSGTLQNMSCGIASCLSKINEIKMAVLKGVASKIETRKSPSDLRSVIEAKKQLLADLRNKHKSEVAMGSIWTNQAAQQEAVALNREIKELQLQLSNYYG